MKSYKLQEDSKENTHKFTAKQRVQQFRNQFFKNITNTGFEDVYIQDKQEWNKIQTQIKNPTDNRLKQKRNHSVMNFDKISKKQSMLSNQKINIEIQKDVGSSLNKREIKVRKDFDAKVDNITKINDKIFDLLKYVKQRPVTQQQKKPEYNIESLRAMQLKKIKQSLEKQSKYKHKAQRVKNNSFQQAINASQNTATFQHIQTNIQKPIKSKYSIPMEQDSIENIRQKTQTNQYLPKRYHKAGYQIKNSDLSAPKTERQKYQYFNYQGNSTDVQEKINLRKTQMLDQINLRNKSLLENQINNSKKNEKSDSKNNFNYSKYFEEPQIKTPERPRKSIGIVKNSPMQQPKKQITEFSIDNQINKVRTQIQQSQSQRQKLAKKYSEYNLKSNTKQDQKDNNIKRKSQLTLSVNPPTSNQEKYKQLQSKYNYENSKKIGSSKLTIKSINAQAEQIVTSERKMSTNAFELKLYPCQSVEKKEATLLAEVLGSQVSHDQRLRQVRERFISYNNQEKWQILKQMLAEKNIKISVRELEEELTITADEHNPFSKQLQNSGSDLISELAQVYSKSLNFWQKKLSRCVSKRMLQKQSFYMKDIDLQKKGYLSVEDLVCFVNLFSGNFFRNRDFIMVYKRFLKLQNSKNGIEYNTLLNKISSD